MISVSTRGRAIRFTWPCGCWVAFASDADMATPFPGDYEDEDFLAWRLADLHRWCWIGEGVCRDPTHGWDPEQKRELRGRTRTSRPVDLDVPEDDLQPIGPLARYGDPIYDLHPTPMEAPPCP